MLWIGNRTRNFPGAHIEFFRNIENVIGLKVDSSLGIEEFIKIVQTLNPSNFQNKLIVITRFGAGKVKESLSQMAEAKQKFGLNFLWMSDPMHGNTYTSSLSNVKTRDFSSILNELLEVTSTLSCFNETLHGIHLEASFEKVTEVIGGVHHPIREEQLNLNYKSGCDPRLNAFQTLDLISEFGRRKV